MATERNYDEERPSRRPAARPPLSYSVSNWLTGIAAIAMVLIVGYLAWPIILHNLQGGAAAVPQTAPTLAPERRQQFQQAAPATSSEQQTLKQAIPTEDAHKPPLLPAQATAAAVQQPIVAPVDAAQYSPVDLGWAPIPTPTSMLSQEQFDESQASEEVNYLNNAEAGLTEAQKLVKIHEAEQQAKGQP